jgi:hypothetical protein
MAKQEMVDVFDAQELAVNILGLDENLEYDDVEEAFMKKFHTDLDHFAYLLGYLVPMIDVGTSELTGNSYKGFSIDLGGDDRMFIVKTEV